MSLCRVFIAVTAVLTLGSSAFAEESVRPLLEGLTSYGFQVVSSSPGDEKDEYILFLQRGEMLFACSVVFKRDGAALVNGPWNRYRGCTQLSGFGKEIIR